MPSFELVSCIPHAGNGAQSCTQCEANALPLSYMPRLPLNFHILLIFSLVSQLREIFDLSYAGVIVMDFLFREWCFRLYIHSFGLLWEPFFFTGGLFPRLLLFKMEITFHSLLYAAGPGGVIPFALQLVPRLHPNKPVVLGLPNAVTL